MSKVEPQHLQRRAYVYVRQSTMAQVERNVESRERQYELVDRAVALGWHAGEVVVVDCDQGQSGKNTDVAAFIGAQSLQKPFEYTDPDATSNARLAARLPYLFASCRFAHYLKCMVRDKVGSFKERSDMERYLSDWIMGYVILNPEAAGETARASKPLAGAEVKVEEVEGNPGYYSAKFHLRPHYQLEGVSVTMSLVSRLPSQRAA